MEEVMDAVSAAVPLTQLSCLDHCSAEQQGAPVLELLPLKGTEALPLLPLVAQVWCLCSTWGILMLILSLPCAPFVVFQV